MGDRHSAPGLNVVVRDVLVDDETTEADAWASASVIFSIKVKPDRQARLAHSFRHRQQEATSWQNGMFDFVHVGFERLQTWVAGLQVERIAVADDTDLEFFRIANQQYITGLVGVFGIAAY